MFTTRTSRRMTATLSGLVALVGLSLSITSAQAQNDPRWQHRRGQQQHNVQRPAPQHAAPPVFNRPQFQPQPQQVYRPPMPPRIQYGAPRYQPPQQAYRPPMPRIHYGAPRYQPPQPVYRPYYAPPPVDYAPPPRFAGPQVYEIDEPPVYARRFVANRACRVVNQRFRGQIIAVRQCRVCRPVVKRDRYGHRIRVDRCAWVRR